jgi:cytochrome b
VTRVWHWVLALAILLTWPFGKFMSFDTVLWHFYLGYLILGLMLIRLIWGLVGPQPIRLSRLFYRPTLIIAYFKTLPKRHPSGSAGHNPLGALSVIAMLVIITLQALSGLFLETEDFFEYAPLNKYVSEDTMKFLLGWHHRFADLILILVILHISAILFYLVWKNENLIKPMLSGWKKVKREEK